MTNSQTEREPVLIFDCLFEKETPALGLETFLMANGSVVCRRNKSLTMTSHSSFRWLQTLLKVKPFRGNLGDLFYSLKVFIVL